MTRQATTMHGSVIVLSILFLAAPVSARAAQTTAIPDEWIDLTTRDIVLADVVDLDVAGDANGKLQVGYSFPLRDDVTITCSDGDRGRYLGFGSGDVAIVFGAGDIEARHLPCREPVGVFFELDAATRTIARARLMTLRHATTKLRPPVVWAGDFSAADSIAFLGPAVLSDGVAGSGSLAAPSARVRGRLLAAVALHDDPEVLEIVGAALNPSQPSELRESAVVWTGHLGGDDGVAHMLELARTDRDVGVRKQAIFWLGQLAGEAATQDLVDIAESDSDTDVRNSAVFALSQSDDDTAIDALISIVRRHRNPDVVKSALFWLGESGDVRAIELFEELLFGRR